VVAAFGLQPSIVRFPDAVTAACREGGLDCFGFRLAGLTPLNSLYIFTI